MAVNENKDEQDECQTQADALVLQIEAREYFDLMRRMGLYDPA